MLYKYIMYNIFIKLYNYIRLYKIVDICYICYGYFIIIVILDYDIKGHLGIVGLRPLLRRRRRRRSLMMICPFAQQEGFMNEI